jgi:hypothetical protein
MKPADFVEAPDVRFAGETADRIRAKQVKPVSVSELVPQFLEADRPVRIAFAPEHVDHLAERAHAALAVARTSAESRADVLAEQLAVGHPAGHDPREHFLGTQQRQLP